MSALQAIQQSVPTEILHLLQAVGTLITGVLEAQTYYYSFAYNYNNIYCYSFLSIRILLDNQNDNC